MKLGNKMRRGGLLLVVSYWLLVSSAGAASFNFAVFGDNRDGDKVFSSIIDRLNRDRSLAFAVNTGDFVSSGKKNEYEKYLGMISGLKIKLYHTPGNHDMVGQGYRYFEKYFGSSYYSFDYENAHFIVLDNAFRKSFDAHQFNWLKKDLKSTKKEHIFVFMHRPTFDPTEIYAGYVMSSKRTAEELMRLFSRSGVDYVFAGHVHGYAREKRNGVTYVVTAGAGAPLYLPKEFGGFYHYVKVAVDGDKITDETKKIYERGD